VYSAATLGSTNFVAGDVVSLLVEASDGQAVTSRAANPVTIGNTAPTTPLIGVTPASPQAGESLTCTVTTPSTDADGDAITYTYVWLKNGTQFSSETSNELTSVVDGANVGAGETWTCRVVASDGRGGTSSPAESVSGEPTISFSSDVLSIMSSCTGCHGSSGGLNLRAANAYTNLVGVNAAGCNGEVRVIAGDSQNSYLIKKIEGRHRAGCGNSMHPNTPISATNVAIIRQWIDDGALNN
jgi:hypothetical protein